LFVHVWIQKSYSVCFKISCIIKLKNISRNGNYLFKKKKIEHNNIVYEQYDFIDRFITEFPVSSLIQRYMDSFYFSLKNHYVPRIFFLWCYTFYHHSHRNHIDTAASRLLMSALFLGNTDTFMARCAIDKYLIGSLIDLSFWKCKPIEYAF